MNANAWFTFGLQSAYGASILPVTPYPCGLRGKAGGDRKFSVIIKGSVASTILYREVYKFEKSQARSPFIS